MFNTPNALARSGCCSYHQGVRADGCGCNDGTPLSSTCAPYYTCNASHPTTESNYVQPNVIPISTPTPTVTPSATPTPTITPKPTKKPIKKQIKRIIKHKSVSKSWWQRLLGL